MKKLLTIFAFLLATISYSQIGSDMTTVNIILSEVYSIEVMDNQVDLIVDTASKYENGTSALKPNHIKITSTVDYQLDLQLSSNYTNGVDNIPANKVKVKLLEGMTNLNEIPTNISQTNILPISNAVVARYLNAEYTLEGGSHLLLDPDTYSAQLTYILIPQ